MLRPTQADDAARAFEIQSNENVTRNLRMASFPPDAAETAAWFASHEAEWLDGTGYRFAILHQHRMIGVIDLDEIHDDVADIGYWLDEPYWGQGFATEAGHAVIAFARDTLGLSGLRSGHADDNGNSGHVLTKLGLHYVDAVTIPSRARGADIRQRRLEMRF